MKKVLSFVLSLVMLSAVFASVAVFYTEAASSQIVLGVNAINTTGKEGHSLIITPEFSKALSGMSWWRSVTFEWDDSADAYVVRSVDTLADGSNVKNNYVPENGFVLVVNTGNDYGYINYVNKLSSDCFANVPNLREGDKAYLAGIDLSKRTVQTSGGDHWKDTFTSDAKIYIGTKPEGVEIYTPDTSKKRLPAVNLECDAVTSVSKGISMSWDAVADAEYYIVNVNYSTNIPDGTIIVSNQKVTATEYTVPASKLVEGAKYTVSVAAYGAGFRSSFNTRRLVSVFSDEALNSPFVGKKVCTFGDSITAFGGWTSMLGGRTGADIINAGVGGDKTTEALARIGKDVLAVNPDIVIVMFGMNDQAINMAGNTPLVSKTQYEKNYRKIIEMIHASGAEVILLTGHDVCTASGYYVKGGYNLDYGTGNLGDYYGIIRKLAKEYNLNLVDMNEIIADKGIASTVICASGDGIHLSTKGKEYYAEWIADYMLNDYFENGYTDPAGIGLEKVDTVNYSDYKVSDGIVSGVLCGTDARSFAAQIMNSEKKITLSDGTPLGGNDKIMTGCIVESYVGGVKKDSAKIAVKGDISPDGAVDTLDFITLRLSILGVRTLGDAEAKAGDVNGDGNTNVTDYIAIRLHILGISEIR